MQVQVILASKRIVLGDPQPYKEEISLIFLNWNEEIQAINIYVFELKTEEWYTTKQDLHHKTNTFSRPPRAVTSTKSRCKSRIFPPTVGVLSDPKKLIVRALISNVNIETRKRTKHYLLKKTSQRSMHNITKQPPAQKT